MKTALAAFATIVEQGEGAPEHSLGSHFQKFLAIRSEYAALKAENPDFQPAFPAAHNPVLRPPMGRTGRVWIEDEEAAETVDLANTGYALMLRLLAHSYLVSRPMPEKALAVDLSIGLMRAVTLLAERAARLPAGPSNPDCNAGMSFTALRDAASLPPGASTRRFFAERLAEMAGGRECAGRKRRPARDQRRAHPRRAAPSAPSAALPQRRRSRRPRRRQRRSRARFRCRSRAPDPDRWSTASSTSKAAT